MNTKGATSYPVPGALPCPFCGSERVHGSDHQDCFPYVVCELCGGSGPAARNREEALGKWNRRGEGAG
jgi:Lar family restriction alleviation protein